MKVLSSILKLTILLGLPVIMHAQEINNKNSIELNAYLLGGSSLRLDDNNTSPISFIQDTIFYAALSRTNTELQVKFVGKLPDNIRLGDPSNTFHYYIGISLGAIDLVSSYQITDQPIISSTGSKNDSQKIEPYIFQYSDVKYAAVPIGLRLAMAGYNNDRINFSLGGKVSYFPKQDLNFENAAYSNIRDEELTLVSKTSLQSNANMAGSIEADINYQLVTKKERFKFMLGVILSRNITSGFTVESSLDSPTVSLPYKYEYIDNKFGIYLGTAIAIGK